MFRNFKFAIEGKTFVVALLSFLPIQFAHAGYFLDSTNKIFSLGSDLHFPMLSHSQLNSAYVVAAGELPNLIEMNSDEHSLDLLSPVEEIIPDGPEGTEEEDVDSAFAETVTTTPEESDPSFCEVWNPEYAFLRSIGVTPEHGCCMPTKTIRVKSRRNRNYRASTCGRMRMAQAGKAVDFCNDRTPAQVLYEEKFSSAETSEDVLQWIETDLVSEAKQAYCTVNNGFLYSGRPVLPSDKNRIVLNTPNRCTNYGTDRMVALLEWLGREYDLALVESEVRPGEYSKAKMVIGDISGPRGGCLVGISGTRAHSSHRNGLDADLGFLWARPGRASPTQLHQTFELEWNFWLLKKVFSNPYVCVKTVYLDRKWIAKLARRFGRDPKYQAIRKYVQHVPGHRNHFHIRVGGSPGSPGCKSDVIEGSNGSDSTEQNPEE